MRILRGQSNLEVSSKGFALFVVGLILATFFGGAVRTMLSSDQLHQRIVSDLKNRFPKQEFQVGQTEVLLSRGGWPGLGLKVRGLGIKQDVCGKLSFNLNLPQVVLPLDLWSLVHGRWQLNDVQIDGGDIHLDYRDCLKLHESPGPSTAQTATPARKAMPTPKLNWHEVAQSVRGISLKNFAVTYEKSPTWKLVLNSAHIGLSSDLTARAQVDVEKSLPFGALTHPVNFQLDGDDQSLRWNVSTDFKEGRIQIVGNHDIKSGLADVKALIRQVPLKDFMSEVYQMGFVERELKLKATWLSCSVAWTGALDNYAEHPLQVRDCRAEGGYGHAELKEADVWLEGDYLRQPAHIAITQLQMQPVMEALNREVLPAVLSRLGVWDGSVDLNTGAQWALDGYLQNTEIVFSSQSAHGKQVIERLHTQARKVQHRIQGEVDEIQLREGEFAGNLKFNLNEAGRDGDFQARLEKFNFSPSIQKLLIGGVFGNWKGDGKGELREGELTQWSGDFSMPEARGEGWRTGPVQLHSRFSNGNFRLEIALNDASVDSTWKFFTNLHDADNTVPEPTGFKDLNLKAEILKNSGTLQGLSASETARSAKWRVKGAWVRDGDFSGTLSLLKGNKSQVFSVHGENGNLDVAQDEASAH